MIGAEAETLITGPLEKVTMGRVPVEAPLLLCVVAAEAGLDRSLKNRVEIAREV